MPYSITINRRKLDIPQARLSNSRAVYDFATQHVFKKKDAWRESCHLITLDKKQNAMGIFLMSLGSEDKTVIDERLTARIALLDSAPAVILVHNHPQGNPNPSQHDINNTEKVKKALACLNIDLTDHVIIGENAFYSFSDERIHKI